jgi:hypothetical protein
VLGAALLAACAANPAPSCAPGQQAAILDTLYFGTARAHGAVTQQEWDRFVQQQIAPRLPQGFSLLEAQGQWRNADGSIAHESSHVLQVAHAADPRSARALGEIVDRYKAQFEQEAVLRLSTAACMSL